MNNDAIPFTQDVREIVERIGRMVSQPYVMQYVDLPSIAENRLAMLYFFLSKNGVEAERAKVFCVATGLVQMGIDTHELVKLRYENTLVAERNRQLSVLAGDFFSSQYYQLLAQAGEVEVIRILASAIATIHEAKMELYMLEKENRLTGERYLSLRKTIDTALYVGFVCRYAYGWEERSFWTALFEQTSTVEGMIGEWEQIKWQQQVPFGFARYLLQNPGSTLAGVLESIEAKAIELLGACEQLVCNLYPSEKQNPLAWVTNRYSHRVNRLKRVVEEM